MPKRIAISLGDVTGIGPEVALKALAADLELDDTRYILVGDRDYLSALQRELGLSLPLQPFTEKRAEDRVLVYAPAGVSRDFARTVGGMSRGAPEAARAAVAWLEAGARLCLRGEADALVTAPVSKEAIIRAGVPFVGQTEFLSELANTRDTVMMLLGPDDRGRWLRVALATTHLPLRRVAGQITPAKVELAIRLAARACRQVGLTRARVGVCGLNPHAGEGGKMGDEEITVIAPVVVKMQGEGIEVVGPVAADTLFHYALRGDFDAVVAMYHDQGLAPLKMVAFESGINWTLGLPFVRTSPDHGTAYDIAGKNLAHSSSMRAAMKLARQLAPSNSTYLNS